MKQRLFGILVATIGAVGCGFGADADDEQPARPVTTVSPVAPAPVPPPPPPEPAAPQMIAYDLGASDPAWQGWTVQAPEGCQVMVHGTNDARVACIREHDWDLQISTPARDLAQMREGLEIGAQRSNGEMRNEFTVDEPSRLEWTRTGYGQTSFNFVHNLEVGGRALSCGNNFMVGIREQANFERHKAACATLTPPAQ